MRGTFYTHPILLEIGTNGQRRMVSYEIMKAGKYNLIMLFWWCHDKHPIKHIAEPTK